MKMVTCAQMKEAEAWAIETGIPSVRLMENAGSACARFIRDTVPLANTRCTVVCGRGNNGGDGFVAARRLLDSSASVSIILACGAPRTHEAAEMFERLNGLNIPVYDYTRDRRRCLGLLSQSGVIVDAVFGTGFYGRVEGALAELFEAANASGATVFALDMPSGADADTGAVEGACIRAAHTVTFAASKTGQFAQPASEYCGKVTVVNIGIPPEAFANMTPVELLDSAAVAQMLPRRAKTAHKGDFGSLLCLCGSLTMPGAAYMCAQAAARAGAGLVTLGAPKSIYIPLASKLSEVMITPLEETPAGTLGLSALDAITRLAQKRRGAVLGCGLSQDPRTVSLIRRLLPELTGTVVLDADGINAAAGHIDLLRKSNASWILTPHPGEMSRLTGLPVARIQADRLHTAAAFAKDSGAVVVLKGSGTVIASPDGRVFLNPTGNPGMARGGSGDILAGLIAGLAVQGLAPVDAACCGVYIHGLAGDRCAERLSQYGMLPTDLLMEVPQIFRDLSR